VTTLDLLWQKAREDLFLNGPEDERIHREAFEKTLEGWDIEEVEGLNGIAGVFVVRGPEFHFQIFDSSFTATREHLRRYPGMLIDAYGYALTRTPKEDFRQRRFNERLGFFQVGEDDLYIHYKINQLPFREKTPCQ
jgi:hypothetical protein